MTSVMLLRVLVPVILALFPAVGMIFFYMLRLTAHKFEVLYPIVGFYPINMMDSFARLKFSAEMLLHYIPMLKHPITIYPDSIVSVISQLWLTPLQDSPVGGNLIRFVSIVASKVHAADTSLSYKYIPAIINPAQFANHYPYRNKGELLLQV